MIPLFWFYVLVLLIGLAIWLWFRWPRSSNSRRPRSAPTRRPPKTRQPTLFTLEIGDIVQYQTDDWVVEDVLTYNASGWSWKDYQLQNKDQVRWLSVEQDDTLELSWTESVQLSVLNPPPKEITYGNRVYHQQEFGPLTMTMASKPGIILRGTYFDYASADDHELSLEQWGEDTAEDISFEVSIGYALSPRELDLLPGDGQGIYRYNPQDT